MAFLHVPASVYRTPAANPQLIAPYYGVADSYATITQELILGLQYRGTAGQLATTIHLPMAIYDDSYVDGVSPREFAYFAYPKAWGKAQFKDLDTSFYGGWDGAKWFGPNTDAMDMEKWGSISLEVDTPQGRIEMLVYRTDWFNIGPVLNFQVEPDSGWGT